MMGYKDAKRLVCGRCGREWMYKGKNPYYASCPKCYTKVKVEKQSVGGVEE